jgi:hypothetical protein
VTADVPAPGLAPSRSIDRDGDAMTQDKRPRGLVVAQDLDNPGYLWRVEWFDSDGAGYITIFAGQEAEARARDYHDAIRDGRLDSRSADAQRGGHFTISPDAERPAPRRRKRA